MGHYDDLYRKDSDDEARRLNNLIGKPPEPTLKDLSIADLYALWNLSGSDSKLGQAAYSEMRLRKKALEDTL